MSLTTIKDPDCADTSSRTSAAYPMPYLYHNRTQGKKKMNFMSYKRSNQAYDLKKLSGMGTQPHKPLPRLPILTTRISIYN